MSEDWTEEDAKDDVADEETIYEIELDDEDEEEMSEEDMPAEEEVDEAARTKWNVHGGTRSGLKSKKVYFKSAYTKNIIAQVYFLHAHELNSCLFAS